LRISLRVKPQLFYLGAKPSLDRDG
jgi:hypothetical protein